MPREATKHALAARGVSVVLGGKQIVDAVDASVDYGQLHVIAGPNGAGKSTLLRTLLGLLEPAAGQVFCDGVELDRLTRLERARRVAYVPQQSLLDAAISVGEVVAQARYAHDTGRRKNAALVEAALERVGMVDLAHRSYLTLSGGERRLTLIARALCTEAKVICLDEPTAALDVANRLRTMELLRDLAEHGHAVVCVLHDLEDVRRFADRVVLLSEGRVHASGAPSEVIAPEAVRTVYGVELVHNDAIGFRLVEGAAP